MRSPESFFWLASQAVGHEYFLVPVAACLGAAMLAAASNYSEWKRVRRQELWLLLLPGAIGLLVLICGAAFASVRDRPSDLGQWLVAGLFLLELPVAGWVVYRLAGVRVTALLLTLPQDWFAAWAFFVSSMAVRGIWL
jgi:hypothetical protein